MSVAASALALARPFHFDNQVHQIKPLTYEDLARFGLWLEERAKAAAYRAIEAGDADAKTVYGAFLDRVAACQYEPGSEVFDAATRTNSGQRKLLELMLGGDEPLSWAMYAEPDAFALVVEVMGEVNRDPLAQRLRRTPGLPAAPSR